eukprot:gene2724-3407_t
MLVAARLLQGLGAAMMMPVGRIAIIRTFPKAELLSAMNFVIIPALIGPLLGPTVGGLIVHWMSWREIFFINVPVGVAAIIAVVVVLGATIFFRLRKAIAVSLIIVDSTIVNVVVPYIVRDLSITSTQVQWVQESYTLVFAAFLLVF